MNIIQTGGRVARYSLCVLLLQGWHSEAQARVTGEIIWMASNYCPRGTLPADGGYASQSQQPDLYSVIGDLYTPPGATLPPGTFVLPNLAGAYSVGAGQGTPGLFSYTLGETGGDTTHTVTAENVPDHSHTFSTVTVAMKASSADADRNSAHGKYFAKTAEPTYVSSSTSETGGIQVTLSGKTAANVASGSDADISATGRTPYLALSPCIVIENGYVEGRYTGEVFWTGNETYCPTNSADADGSQLSINSNQSLYSVIGVSYGGDNTQFALPDLRGRTAIGADGQENIPQGQASDIETMTATAPACPPHKHIITDTVKLGNASANASSDNPSGLTLGKTGKPLYSTTQACATNMADDAIALTGALAQNASTSSQITGLSSRNPYTTLRACIAISGTYPQRPE